MPSLSASSTAVGVGLHSDSIACKNKNSNHPGSKQKRHDCENYTVKAQYMHSHTNLVQSPWKTSQSISCAFSPHKPHMRHACSLQCFFLWGCISARQGSGKNGIVCELQRACYGRALHVIDFASFKRALIGWLIRKMNGHFKIKSSQGGERMKLTGEVFLYMAIAVIVFYTVCSFFISTNSTSPPSKNTKTPQAL
ncbi:uncharacterized protein NEMAJ01_1109 [Nematocida major]|uniref:uncharacterized protein n=1 Tax=Nematocida major TaxID=1912982 RepID=UPI002007AF64|nr:uncharacterized protein NEMAJ01_1109 [Nematocida major]KAH9386213.1 hypothetical protein NEMAJ01_1109 [Nematocida major]